MYRCGLDSRLLDAQVSVDAGVSGSASEVLVLSVRNVLLGPGVSVLLGQTKINDEQLWRKGRERVREREKGESEEEREREKEKGGGKVAE